jgi:hypothetical protein
MNTSTHNLPVYLSGLFDNEHKSKNKADARRRAILENSQAEGGKESILCALTHILNFRIKL